MGNIIKAEHLKFKRTFGKFLPVIAPLVTLLLALVFTGGLANVFPAGTWNWWYATLLPGTLAVICYLSVAKDRKNHYYNLKSLAVPGWKLMLGKILYLASGLLAANVMIFFGATIGGAILGSTIPVGGAAMATILLTLSYLWEIPARLMCPTLGIRPNGLPIPAGSELWSTHVILPGILLSFAWFIVCAILFEIWFEKMDVK